MRNTYPFRRNLLTATSLMRPRPFRGKVENERHGASAWCWQTAAKVTLFLFGVAAWIFKLGNDKVGNILPVSPSQIGLPLAALVALCVIAQVWRLHFPPIANRSWSMRLVNAGIVLVLIGTIVHVARDSDYRMEAVLYFGRWLLPWSALLTIALGMWYGGRKDYVVYGLLFGSVVSVICVEANRRGFPLPLQKMGDSRFAGLLNHPNDYGILTSSLAPFIVYLLHKKSWLMRLSACGFLTFFALALFESLSKTNMVLFPIVLAGTFVGYSLTDIRKMLRTIALIGVSVFAGAFLFALILQVVQQSDPKQFEILTQFATDPSSVGSLDDRQNAWSEAVSYVHESPWFGEGPGWAGDHLMFTHAHNMFLQAWIDVGLLGLMGTILIALGVLFRSGEVISAATIGQGLRDDEARLQMACAIALVTAILGNSMSSSLQTTTMQSFAMLLALSFFNPTVQSFFGSGRLSRRHSERAQPLRSSAPVAVQNRVLRTLER